LTWKSLQWGEIPVAAATHNLGSRNRTPPQCTDYPPCVTPPAKSIGARRNAKICGRTPSLRNHPRVMESICSQLLLHQEERWETAPRTGLLPD
jgi:hypothetical protein